MVDPINHGSKYFDEAKKFYSEAALSLYLLADNEKERFARETAQKVEAWRQRWISDKEACKYTALITAVDMMLNHEIYGE